MESLSGKSPEIAEGYVAIGQISAAWGVRGELKVTPHTDFPERFAQPGMVYLGPNAQPVRLLSSRPHQDSILIRLEGYPDRTSAEKLAGLWVQIPANEVKPLDEGEHYAFQLMGVRVRTTDGRELGQITEVLFTGANEVFVVQGEAGEVLVPYIGDVIAEDNVAAGEIVVYPIPGLLD